MALRPSWTSSGFSALRSYTAGRGHARETARARRLSVAIQACGRANLIRQIFLRTVHATAKRQIVNNKVLNTKYQPYAHEIKAKALRSVHHGVVSCEGRGLNTPPSRPGLASVYDTNCLCAERQVERSSGQHNGNNQERRTILPDELHPLCGAWAEMALNHDRQATP